MHNKDSIAELLKMNDRDLLDDRNDVDWTQFEAITCGFLPEFIDVYREFERELPKLFISLQKAIATSSLEQIISLAHQIKGSAANFGFIGTSQPMHELEHAAKNTLLHHAELHLACAQEAFHQARVKVNRRLNQL